MNFRFFFRQIFLACLFTCGSGVALAQKTYLKAGSSYNFGLGSSVPAYATNGTLNKDNTAAFTITQQKVNFGEGWLFNLAAGHFFNENLAAELGLSYLPGKSHKTESRVYHANYGITEGLYTTYEAKIFMLQPAVVVRTSPKTITPYGRFGFSLAKVSLKETENHTLWTNSEEMEIEYSGNLGFGLQGGAGVDFIANSQVTFFVEMNFSSMSWAPAKRKITDYRENNETKLDQIPPGDQETIYTEEFTMNYDKNGMPITSNGPGNDLKDHLPMNTIGLGFGMKYTF